MHHSLVSSKIRIRMQIGFYFVVLAILGVASANYVVDYQYGAAFSKVRVDYQYFRQEDIEVDANLRTLDLVRKYGYPSETHFAYTLDGYKLSLHRIPAPSGIPILLVHGLMSSSASWVQFGPSTGLAYLLYQKGYDVWMLNTRGNIYSQEHNEKRVGDSSYWDFSFHDIGQYDIPAAIDYILAKTNRLDIQYIGHSQGSTAFYVMCSERPEYAAKVKLMQSLSPAVFVRNAVSPALKFLSAFKGGLNTVFSLLGGYKITLNNKLIDMFRKNICSANLVTSRICAIFEFVVCGFNWRNFNQTLSAIVEGHASQGGSAKQIYHYAQMLGRSIFQRYDYGLILNRIRYRSNYPPSYNLSQVSSKVAIHYGEGDWVGSESDAVQLQHSLPNCIENRKINSQAFAHYDFIISKDVRPLVYTRIINLCDSNR